MELKRNSFRNKRAKSTRRLNIEIENIESDSRKVKDNTLFIAIKGFETDGHNFIEQAIANGAIAVMVQQDFELKSITFPSNVTIIVAPDTRYALAICACNFTIIHLKI